jgi:alginate O-acetyltransferase complex protein AlgI
MSWKPEYIILILISTIIDYVCGWQIYKSDNRKRRRLFLIISLITNLGILAAFKYFNFFSESAVLFLQQFSLDFSAPTLQVLLPVGISFYTFQTLSYTIDIYRRKIKPEKHLGIFAVYVSFFPQLVAGPIERAKNLLPQFAEKYNFDYKRVTDGLKLMLWGFYKKIVIADGVAIIVDNAFNSPGNDTGVTLLIATILFAFQIFCDFSGYSDIAIGAAQVMGFRLMTNFRRPYHAHSISDFWHRWHISLSTWFKDYLYIPLGGSKVKIPRWYLNLFIVFLVSGLWHGANWTFVVWGALHGIYMISSIVTLKWREKFNKAIGLIKIPRIHKLLQIIFTFILVNIGWVFFRANNVSEAWEILKKIATWIYSIPSLIWTHVPISQIIEYDTWKDKLGLDTVSLCIIIGAILFMEIVHLIQRETSVRQFMSEKPRYLRWVIYLILIWAILILGVFGEREFIYFQF